MHYILTADYVRADDTDVIEHVRPEPRPERYRRQNCGRFRVSVFVKIEKKNGGDLEKNKTRNPINTRYLRGGVYSV